MNPIDSHCPICLATPGDPCEDQFTGEPTTHGMRGVLVRCACCQGFGWRPEGLETKGGHG